MSMGNNAHGRGFSLVETLVAITILLIVITGPLTISTTTARSTSFASEQVSAFFLAQEGLELAQKARDDLLLQADFSNPGDVTTKWNIFTNTSGTYRYCFQSPGCGLEFDETTLVDLRSPVSCSGTNCLMYYDETAARTKFTHQSTGNVATIYTRKIYFSNISSDEVQVRVLVTWRTGTLRAQQKVEAETYLYNVYGN